MESMTKLLLSKYWQLEDQHESTFREMLAHFGQESRPPTRAADESSANDRTSGRAMHRATAAIACREHPV